MSGAIDFQIRRLVATSPGAIAPVNPFKRLRSKKKSVSAEEAAEERRVYALLDGADACRDAGNWLDAAAGYEAFLKERPDAAGIWVQLGHMLKEAGGFDNALSAYKQAQALEPETADTALMVGHLYKRHARYDEAETAYGQALSLDPSLRDAFRELSALGAAPQAHFTGSNDMSDGAQKTRVLLDLSDVFKFLKDYATVSGIQRVQLSMTESLLKAKRADLVPSYLDEDTRAYYTVDAGLILELAKLLAQPNTDHGALKDVIARAEAGAEPYLPVAGDTVFVAGAFWMLPDGLGIYSALKKAGVHIGVYIYDVIPVTHPEYCASELVARFSRCLFHFLSLADFIFTISDFSGEELLKHFSSRVPGLAPVTTARLAHTLAAEPSDKGASRKVQPLLEKPFVLFVSTLEARKNHAFVYRAWQLLIERHGPDKVPDLVFVGRKGWRVDDLVHSFEDSRHLDGKLHVLAGIDDADLALLYRGAEFTVFPSFMEGWGLPIGESLAFGTPCVASHTSSMPEVAGDFVDYVDPYNISGGVDLLEELLFTDGALAARRKRIADDFTPVGWPEVAGEMLTQIDGHIKRLNEGNTGEAETAPAPAARLGAGRFHQFEGSNFETRIDKVGQLANADLVFGGRWSWETDQIKWLTGKTTTLRCRVDGVEAADGTIYIPVQLDVRLKSGASLETRIEFSSNDDLLGSIGTDDAAQGIIVAVPLGPDGSLTLDITVTGKPPRDSRLRPILLGVAGLGLGTPVEAPFFTSSVIDIPQKQRP